MLELGAHSEAAHAGIGEYLAEKNIDCVIAVGPEARHIYDAVLKAGIKGKEARWFATKEDAYPAIDEFLKSDSSILVKASRSMHFEEIVSHIERTAERGAV